MLSRSVGSRLDALRRPPRKHATRQSPTIRRFQKQLARLRRLAAMPEDSFRQIRRQLRRPDPRRVTRHKHKRATLRRQLAAQFKQRQQVLANLPRPRPSAHAHSWADQESPHHTDCRASLRAGKTSSHLPVSSESADRQNLKAPRSAAHGPPKNGPHQCAQLPPRPPRPPACSRPYTQTDSKPAVHAHPPACGFSANNLPRNPIPIRPLLRKHAHLSRRQHLKLQSKRGLPLMHKLPFRRRPLLGIRRPRPIARPRPTKPRSRPRPQFGPRFRNALRSGAGPIQQNIAKSLQLATIAKVDQLVDIFAFRPQGV